MTVRKKSGFIAYLATGIAALLFINSAVAATDDPNQFSFGIEGFRDNYREPTPDVRINSNYGSVTGKWTHDWNMLRNDKFFLGLDGRFSYGLDSYRSPQSGTYSGAKQEEFDGRILAGFRYGDFLHGTLSPYTGIGLRYFIDNGKGEVSSTGAHAYDRRITQSYVPLGTTYAYNFSNGWSIAPTAEFDAAIRGYVDSRLQTIPGYYDVENTQAHNGWGLRGDIMVGWGNNNLSFQAGPFVRFWSFGNSDVVHTPNLPPNMGWEEPNNTRLQYGLALKVLW